MVDKFNDDLVIELLWWLCEGFLVFFECVVIWVLCVMGYGGNDECEFRILLIESYIGRLGDGGIDGIIKFDLLGV